MQQVTFAGKVTSGEGKGKQFVSLPWVQQQIKNQLGFFPFLGTLNLTLTPDSIKNKKLLKQVKAATIVPPKDFCTGLLYKAKIGNIECAVVFPQVENYPINKLEIIAPINLREKLKIKDGDVVNVSVLT